MHLSADSPVVVEYVLGAVMRACAWCKFGCWPERMPWSNARFASAERCSLLGGGGDGDKWLKTTSLLSENKNKNHYIHNFVYFVLICRKQRRKLRCFFKASLPRILCSTYFACCRQETILRTPEYDYYSPTYYHKLFKSQPHMIRFVWYITIIIVVFNKHMLWHKSLSWLKSDRVSMWQSHHDFNLLQRAKARSQEGEENRGSGTLDVSLVRPEGKVPLTRMPSLARARSTRHDRFLCAKSNNAVNFEETTRRKHIA